MLKRLRINQNKGMCPGVDAILFVLIPIPQQPRPQPPNIHPNREHRLPKNLLGVMAEQVNVAAEVVEESFEGCFAGAPGAGVGVAHVAGEEDFVEEEAAFFFVGGQELVGFVGFKAEDFVEEPHEAGGEAGQAEFAEPVDCIGFFFGGEALFQDIVVVHDLAKADAVAGQVAVAVEEDEDAVECEAGHR